MAFSYTKGSTAIRDRVRLELGDTDESRVLFEDAELDDLIVQETNVYPTAARACEILAVRFARDFDFTADGANFRKSSISMAYQKLANRLRARGRGTAVVMPQRVDGYSQITPSDDVTRTPRGTGVAL